jgi:hypothetical protein
MKTPNLFDVPKDSPTRKERVEAFKETHGIQTHGTGCTEDPDRWCAVLFDVAWKRFGCYCANDRSFFGLMAGACLLVTEAGLDGYGDTETTAIRRLCAQNGIRCDI